MATIERPSGVAITAPSGVAVTDIAGAPGSGGARVTRGRGRGRLPSGPVPMPSAAAGSGTDPVVEAMQAQEMTLVDSFEIEPAPAAPGRRRGPSDSLPSGLSVPLDDAEDAAVLLEQDGLYVWRFPSEAAAEAEPARRRTRGPGERRVVTFDLSVPTTATPDQRRRRGPITDFIIGKVRTYVFRFIAREASKAAIGFLERSVRPGLVVIDSDDPAQWRRIERLTELSLPTDRPARILLFVHGTFSSTIGGFGALVATGWGRAFLATARSWYDAVIGFEHPTLSVTPRDNATDLLARFEGTALVIPPEIHAIAHSRGALTLRSFIEYVLPNSPLKDWRVRRAVFVGGTNGGTELADPDKIERFVDLWTNLAVGGSRALDALGTPIAGMILRETLQSLGALVKHLSAATLEDRAIPGVAAMVPRGDFVSEINALQPGQPSADDSFYCVITSNFDIALLAKGNGPKELPARLGAWALDAFADGIMAEDNDMVVHVRGMGEIDADVGAFVKDRLDFGKNAEVYHTNYFTRPEVTSALHRWLELGGQAAPPGVEATPAAPERRTRGTRSRMTRSARPKKNGGGASAPTPAMEPDTAPPPAAAPAEPESKTKLFTTAKMPSEVEPEDEVDVEVTLSRKEIAVSAGPTTAAGSVTVDESIPLLVRVVAKTRFQIVGTKSVELDPRAQERFDLVFTVRATEPGEGEVIVVMQQGAFVLGRLTLTPVVKAGARKSAPAAARDADVPAAGQCTTQVPVLVIQETGDKANPQLEFTLFDGRRYYLAQSAPIKTSLPSYVETVYKRIEEFWVQSQEQVARFEEMLAEYGGELFDELIPREIQQPLWEARDTLKAIQVLSEEPYIPWELVHLREPGKVLPAERHFLATKGLVRWIFNAPDAPCELKVRSGHGFYAIPDYPHADYKLPEARKEIAYLEGTLKATPLDLPSSQLVAALGERDRVDFFHFAGHGDADAQRAAEDARVMLTGEVIGGQYHAEYLEERQIRTRLDFRAGGTRPVVTLNACRAGRASWNLTKVGGFAKSFVDGGAGVFVGALWEVGDGHARQFTEAFYDALRSNHTLSVAATNARLKARESGESTWLAYVVYGYPHATVRFQ